MSQLQSIMLSRVARRGARALAGSQGAHAGAFQSLEQSRAMGGQGQAQAAAVKLTNTMTPEEIRARLLQPSFPVHELTRLLDHDNHQMRADFRKFISEPVMVPR